MFKSIVAVLAMSVGLVSCCFSQQTTFDFDTTALLKNLKQFSSDSMGGRGLGQPGGEKAKQFVETRFDQLGLKKLSDSWRQEFAFINPFKKAREVGENILGWIEGSEYPDQYIVISSHHDHLGKRDSLIYNGADDNGSGTCALFCIAEYFIDNPPKHSIIFAAFDAEENGLIGSKHFVNKPPVPIKNIVFNLNLDMVSRNEKQEIFICGTHHYEKLKPVLAKVDSLVSINVIFGHDSGEARMDDWTYASDHGSFHKKKIPFVYLGVEDHEDYHKPTDDFELIDPAFYVEAVRAALFISVIIDGLDKVKAIR